MINRTYSLIIALLVSIGFVQGQSRVSFAGVNGPVQAAVQFGKAANVNVFDTIVINLDQVVLHADTIDIPVAIVSDDTVNALDFSLKYDHVRLQYDSTLSLRSYISALAYYNPNDSTIRYTSYSTVNYEKDTTIVLVRFVLVNGTGFVMPFDFSHLNGYLNGDACTIVVRSDAFAGIQTPSAPVELSVFPNPAAYELNLHSAMLTEFEVMDALGKSTGVVCRTDASGDALLNVGNLQQGVYFIHALKRSDIVVRPIVVTK